ncbi:hypothetical protein GCM10011533_36160 [Streptosporangium jomthongense]|nr:hypothetical protein GCM10011533_36160 [Streptosporangium jomthongense]
MGTDVAICFIVEREKPCEPDILTSVVHLTLTVLDAGRNLVFEMPVPKSGWSQRMLESVTAHLTLPELDAFLGDTWVGSTEI